MLRVAPRIGDAVRHSHDTAVVPATKDRPPSTASTMSAVPAMMGMRAVPAMMGTRAMMGTGAT